MRIYTAGLALTLSWMPSSAMAEEGEEAPRGDAMRVGIGFSFDAISQMQLLGYYDEEVERLKPFYKASAVRVPIRMGEKFFIEPQLSRASISDEDNTFSTTLLRVAAAPSWQVGPKASAYAGGRVGAMATTYGEDSVLDLSLGLLAGVEYWVGRSFSIGGEARLEATHLGKGDSSIEDATITATGADLVLRFYLMP